MTVEMRSGAIDPVAMEGAIPPPDAAVAAPIADTYPPLGRAIGAFLFLMVAEFFYGWAWNSVDVLRPYIRETLGLTLTQAGSGYSAQGAGALIGAVFLGQLADRFGRRRMLMVIMVGYGLVLLSGTAVATYQQYLAQRFVLGLFMGGVFPIVVGIYVGLFRSNVGGRLASLINAIFTLSIACLGLAAGRLAGQDWRLLLWIGGLPPILLAIAAYVFIPASADIRRSKSASRKLPVSELFAPAVRRRTLMLASLTGLNFFAYQAYSGWLTTYLRDVRHLSPVEIGELVAMVSGANMIGGFVWGWLSDRLGRRFNAFGFLIAAAAIAVFLMAPTHLSLLAGIGAVYGFALSASVVWGPWLTELYPPHLKSTAASIFNWGRIVSFFAPLLTGAMAGNFGLGATMALASVTFAVAGVLWLALPETHPRPFLRGPRLAR